MVQISLRYVTIDVGTNKFDNRVAHIMISESTLKQICEEYGINAEI